MDATMEDQAVSSSATPTPLQPPRLRRPDRRQTFLEPVNLDERLPADHRARLVWAVVEQLDLHAFEEPLVNRGATPGRPAIDPAVLVALWLYATIENVGSARRSARLCDEHDAYRWLCGRVSVNHHTLSDFRVRHEAALDDLFTQLLTALVAQELVTVERLSQDGLRARASAGASSFRRRQTLERLQTAARAHVERVKKELEQEDETTPRQKAARQRAAAEKLARVERTLAVLPELEAIKQHATGKPSRHRAARSGTSVRRGLREQRADRGGGIWGCGDLRAAAEESSGAAVYRGAPRFAGGGGLAAADDDAGGPADLSPAGRDGRAGECGDAHVSRAGGVPGSRFAEGALYRVMGGVGVQPGSLWSPTDGDVAVPASAAD
jgi:transposase